MPMCQHAAIYHRGLLSGIALSSTHLSSCSHMPLGPSERHGSVQSTHVFIHPYTTGALLTELCRTCAHVIMQPYTTGQCLHAIIQPYITGAFWAALLCPKHTCHHSPIYHWGPVNGAQSTAHMSSCSHIPPGNAHMPSCSHIPPGPSGQHCSVHRTPVIIHPYTTGAL